MRGDFNDTAFKWRTPLNPGRSRLLDYTNVVGNLFITFIIHDFCIEHFVMTFVSNFVSHNPPNCYTIS